MDICTGCFGFFCCCVAVVASARQQSRPRWTEQHRRSSERRTYCERQQRATVLTATPMPASAVINYLRDSIIRAHDKLWLQEYLVRSNPSSVRSVSLLLQRSPAFAPMGPLICAILKSQQPVAYMRGTQEPLYCN